MLRLILAVVLIGAAFAGPVTYTHLSPRGSGTLQSLEIDGCDTSKCNFVKGKDAIMRITYTTATTANVHSVHTGKVSGVVLGISVPFPLPEANFCKLDVGTQCPVSPGATNSIVVSVYVDPVYPSLTVPVRFEILDDKNARIIGVQFTVSLVNQSG